MRRMFGVLVVLGLMISACGPAPAASTPAPAATAVVAPTVTPPATFTAIPAATFSAATAAPSAATAAATPSATASATPLAASATPVIKGQNCGTVLMLGPNPPQAPEALQAENCFAQSYQQCATATLIVRLMGVDAGTLHTFTMEKQDGACSLIDTVFSYVVPTRSQVVKTYTCAGLTQNQSGLVVKACGDEGDFPVPAPKS